MHGQRSSFLDTACLRWSMLIFLQIKVRTWSYREFKDRRFNTHEHMTQQAVIKPEVTSEENWSVSEWSEPISSSFFFPHKDTPPPHPALASPYLYPPVPLALQHLPLPSRVNSVESRPASHWGSPGPQASGLLVGILLPAVATPHTNLCGSLSCVTCNLCSSPDSQLQDVKAPTLLPLNLARWWHRIPRDIRNYYCVMWLC